MLIPIIFTLNAIIWLLLIGPLKGTMAEMGAVIMLVMNGGMAIYSYFSI